MEDKLTNFCISLYKIGCFKFGNFTIKDGRKSNFYIDLRLIISDPTLLNELSSLFDNCLKANNIQFDTICGVPYATLPIVTLVAVKTNKPMILRRKEPKGYGTNQLIEGIYEDGKACVIVEDVISTGGSVIETITDVENVGLTVKNVIAIFNREENGVANIEDRGYKVHCLYSLSKAIEILKKNNLLTSDLIQEMEYGKHKSKSPNLELNRVEMAFEKRIEYCRCSSAAKLFSIMIKKKTNLCVSANVTDMNNLLILANNIGPHICIFKIHVDIILLFSEKERDSLKNIAVKHNFLIMEDRKLADISNTVRMQFNKISKWTNLVSAHSLLGFDVLEAIKNAETYNKDVGVFLIAEITSKRNLFTPEYVNDTVALADAYPELVVGIVCQFSRALKHPGCIQMTSDVDNESLKNVDKVSECNTPEIMITNRGADIAVVGKEIVDSDCPSDSAQKLRSRLWNAYLARIR